MSSLLPLPWLPTGFADQILMALNAPTMDYAGYLARVDALCCLFQDLTTQLVAEGEYGEEIIDEAFVRSHDEPGRAWNMDEWNAKHRERGV